MRYKEVVPFGLMCHGKSCAMSFVHEALYVLVIRLLSMCEAAATFQPSCNVSPMRCWAVQCGAGCPDTDIVTSLPGKWLAKTTGAIHAAMHWSVCWRKGVVSQRLASSYFP